jgi:hypothetical protein
VQRAANEATALVIPVRALRDLVEPLVLGHAVADGCLER